MKVLTLSEEEKQPKTHSQARRAGRGKEPQAGASLTRLMSEQQSLTREELTFQGLSPPTTHCGQGCSKGDATRDMGASRPAAGIPASGLARVRQVQGRGGERGSLGTCPREQGL